jgi:hypothetical protein
VDRRPDAYPVTDGAYQVRVLATAVSTTLPPYLTDQNNLYYADPPARPTATEQVLLALLSLDTLKLATKTATRTTPTPGRVRRLAGSRMTSSRMTSTTPTASGLGGTGHGPAASARSNSLDRAPAALV